MIGSTIGRYRVLEKLGEGGMGSVWRAEDPVLGRQAAIKVLPESAAGSAEARQRLLREARAACDLNHSGIAAVYEAGEDDGRVFLVFELIEGETIAERVKRKGPLPVGEALRIAREAAAALGHAHAKGILHRDVTAGNVMLDRDGHARIVDFGLAVPEDQTRVTRPTSAPGTLGYVAPEVVKGEDGDRRSDLYGLGVILYEMLTAHLPFERDRAEAVLYALVHDDPVPPRRHRPELSRDVEAIVLRAIAREPDDRFASAEKLVAALQAGRSTKPRRTRGAGRRRARIVAGVVVAATAAAALVWWPGHEGPERYDSIAVLPLDLPPRDVQGTAHMATGLGDALSTRLGRVSGLRVTPWVTSRRYPPGSLPLPDIARELNVQALLVGSLREKGDLLRIELSLFEGGNDTAAWSAEFEESRSGLLILQERIALAVAHRIRGRLSEEEESMLVRRPTDRADAWDQYLRGAALLQRGDPESSSRALAHFETALAIDPRLAEAHVGVGAVHTERVFQALPGGSLDVAEQAFHRALELAPDLVAARQGLIHVAFNRDDTEECLRIAKDIRETGEVTVEALLAQALGLLLGGLNDEAISLFRVVTLQDPQNQAAHWFLVIALAWGEQNEAAIRAGEQYFRKFGEDGEIHEWMAEASWCRGDMEAARLHFDRSLELFGDDANVYVHFAAADLYDAMGMKAEAARIAEDGIRILEARLDAAPDTENPQIIPALMLLHALAGNSERVRQLDAMRYGSKCSMLLPDVMRAFLLIGDFDRADELATGCEKALAGGRARAGCDFAWISPCYWRERNEYPAARRLVERAQEELDRRRSLYGS